MRMSRERAIGAASWLGLLGGRVDLEGSVTVVSPHLDDAVLSVGAAVSRATRRGVRVKVLTVLAGNPDSTVQAGKWDGDAGFATAGEAARARRAEDERACRIVGARPIWLPFSDDQYTRGGSDSEIRAAVVEAVGEDDVLVPGFPLTNDDHRWLRELLDGAFPAARFGVYAEQPYAARRNGSQGPPDHWARLRASLADQRRKLAACRAYETQLKLLGDPVGAIFRYEMSRGGESAAWIDGGS